MFVFFVSFFSFLTARFVLSLLQGGGRGAVFFLVLILSPGVFFLVVFVVFLGRGRRVCFLRFFFFLTARFVLSLLQGGGRGAVFFLVLILSPGVFFLVVFVVFLGRGRRVCFLRFFFF